MKKTLAFLLMVTMLCGLFSGCTNSHSEQNSTEAKTENTTTAPTTDTTTDNTEEVSTTGTFSVMLTTSAEDAADLIINQVISEATGIYPEYVEISSATADEQFNLMWMSGEYEDVIVKTMSEADRNSYAAQGMIIDLAPYMTEEIMPNFCKYVSAEEIERLKDSEGHIYYFPKIISNRVLSSLCINQEWLDTLGLETPETPEELKNVWIAFKEKDPNGNGVADEIPFGSELVWKNALETLNPLFGMFGTCGGWQVDEDGKVFFGQTTADYKEGVKWLQECYELGLIDAEIFTQDMTSYKAKAQSDTAIFGTTLSYVWTAYTRSFTTTVDQYAHLLPMKNEDGDRLWVNPGEAETTIAAVMVVTSACENPELVCRWVDAMYDPHIGVQIDQAPIGYGVVVSEDGTTWKIDQDEYKKHAELAQYETFADFRAALHTNAYPRVGSDYSDKAANFYWDYSDNIIEICHREKDALYRENCVLTNYMVQANATEEEAEVEATYLTEFTNYWRSTIATWITGNGDVDAEWDAFIDGMNNMGLQELTEVYQARYDRYINN